MVTRKLRDLTLWEVLNICLANDSCSECPLRSKEVHHCSVSRPWDILMKDMEMEVDIDGSKR